MRTSSNRKPMRWTGGEASAIFQAVIEERHREMGRRVERLRLAKGWEQPTLAYKSGVSVGTISRLENAKHEPRQHTIAAIAKALGVKVSDLLQPGDPEEEFVSQLDRIERKLDDLLTLAADGDEDRIAAIRQRLAAAVERDDEHLADTQPAPRASDHRGPGR